MGPSLPRLSKQEAIRSLRYGPKEPKPLDKKRKLPKREVPAAAAATPKELDDFLQVFNGIFGRRDTLRQARLYLLGLLSDLPRKNGETMEAAIPGATQQGVYDFLVRSRWSSSELHRARSEYYLRQVGAHGRNMDIILDEVSQRKQGVMSVGVARQYLGCAGKTDNGQVTVSLHGVAGEWDLPLTGQLYLPEQWAKDSARRKQAKIPEDVPFLTKSKIALRLLDDVRSWDVPPIDRVIGDSGFSDMDMILGLVARKLDYCLGVRSIFTVRLPEEPLPEQPPIPPYRGVGRPPKPPTVPPYLHAVEEVRKSLPPETWRRIAYRLGVDGQPLERHFAALRVIPATRDRHAPEAWLLLERPLDPSSDDYKQYVLTAPTSASLEELAQIAHRRPLIERNSYQNGKQEVGWSDYQGRSWNGYHHHLAMVMLALTWLHLHRHRLPLAAGGPGSGSATTPSSASVPATVTLATASGDVPVFLARCASRPCPLPHQVWESVQATRRRFTSWLRAVIFRELLHRGTLPRIPRLTAPVPVPCPSSA